MGDGNTKPALWAIVTLLVAIVGCAGTVIAAFIAIVPSLITLQNPPQAVSVTAPPMIDNTFPAISATSPAFTPPTATTGQAPSGADDILSGVWQVSQQSQSGSSLEQWDIQARAGQITIVAFDQAVPGVPLPGDYREDLSLSNVTFDGQTLRLSTKRFSSVTFEYDLTIVAPDRIEGSYTSTDTALSDTGIIQGEAGVIKDTGKVIMVKQAE